MNKHIVSSGLFAAVLLTSVPVIADGDNNGPDAWEWVKPSAATLALFGAGALPIFALHLRKPDKKFESRFNAEKLKQNPISKEGIKQLWYWVSDEFIGQKSESRKVKASKEDGSLEISDGAESYGVMGKAYDLIKPAESTGRTLGTLYFGYLLVMKPDGLWSLIKKK